MAAEGAADAEQSAPFQPQLNFSTYSREPPPAAVADKPEQPDDQKLLDAEAPPSSKGRRYAPHMPCFVCRRLARWPLVAHRRAFCETILLWTTLECTASLMLTGITQVDGLYCIMPCALQPAVYLLTICPSCTDGHSCCYQLLSTLCAAGFRSSRSQSW